MISEFIRSSERAREGARRTSVFVLASLLTSVPQPCCYLYNPSIAAEVVLSLQITGAGLEEPAMDPLGRGRAEEEEELSPEELFAAEILVEFSERMTHMSQFPPWGFKRKRSRMISASSRGDSNCNDEVEEQEQTVHPTALKRIRAAGAEDKGRKRSSVSEAGKKEGSPTTPLSWSGNERGCGSTSGGGAGDRSDTTSEAELLRIPAATPAPPSVRPAFQVEIGDKVGNSSSKRGSKKKTAAELRELVQGLSLEQEKLKTEKKRRLQLLQSLRDEHEFYKAQIALYGEKEEAKLPATPPEISSDLAQETDGPAILKSAVGHAKLECSENLDVNTPFVQVMDGTSSIAKFLSPRHVNTNNSGTQDLVMATKSPSDHFIIPDLNIPLQLEDSSDNSSGSCNEHLPQLNKAVVAAEARKHRKECLRGKSLQSGNPRSR